MDSVSAKDTQVTWQGQGGQQKQAVGERQTAQEMSCTYLAHHELESIKLLLLVGECDEV